MAVQAKLKFQPLEDLVPATPPRPRSVTVPSNSMVQSDDEGDDQYEQLTTLAYLDMVTVRDMIQSSQSLSLV